MPAQNYANHRQFVPVFHGVLTFILVTTLIGSVVNLFESFGDHERLYNASLIVVLVFISLMLFYFVRTFPLKAQDRAIRAEENLRHFVLTGQLLDSQLELRQIIALRFAPDDEFTSLAKRAIAEQLSPDAIKRAINNWRADTNRV